jgi:hypothetical protein
LSHERFCDEARHAGLAILPKMIGGRRELRGMHFKPLRASDV